VTAPIGLMAREYKLLLDPKLFKNAYKSGGVQAFWERGLIPIIANRLDLRRGEEPRHEGEFGPPSERVIRFWDTKGLFLNDNEFSLRGRTKLVQGREDCSKQELTLKLRTPDLFIAAATAITSACDDRSEAFEEDIAPLGILHRDPRGGERVVLSDPVSIRCRFARSFKCKLSPAKPLRSLAAVLDLYPGLEAALAAPAGRTDWKNAGLVPGDVMLERLYNGASVKLGAGIDGHFTFTEWYLKDDPAVQRAAEISFKLDIPDAGLAKISARRALMLFTNMQRDLAEIVNLQDDSKTALALPKRNAGDHSGPA